MKTTTIKIATTFTAAIKAGVTGIVSVISAAASSRLGWRHVVRGVNPGVVGHGLALLVQALGMQCALPALASDCRPTDAASSRRRPSYSAACRLPEAL